MTTLPRATEVVADIHPKLTHELRRALSDRQHAKERGDWVTVQACQRVIETLMRVQIGART